MRRLYASALASHRAIGARSIAEELFFSGQLARGVLAIFGQLPPGGFALALGGVWPTAEGGPSVGSASGTDAFVSSSADGGNDLFGIPIPPEAGQAMLIMLMTLGAMCLLALFFGDELPARLRSLRARWPRGS